MARKLLSGPIFILLVPFTLHRVGSVGYGVWSVLGSIIGLGWLLDMGLGATVTKFVAEHNDNTRAPQLRTLIDTTIGIYIVIAAAAVGSLVLFARPIMGELFRGPQAPSVRDLVPLWTLLLPIVALDLVGKPFMTMITGSQRFDLVNVILFCGAATNAAFTVLFLCLGAKVQGLLWASILGASVTFILSFAIAHHFIPLIPNPFHFQLATAKRILTFSLGVYSGAVMTTIQGQLEKLYLARLVGVVPVGWYGMASDGAGKVRRLPDLLLAPVLPAASELHAGNERRKISELYFRTQKYTALSAVPLVVFALVDSKALITLWLSSKFAFIAVPFSVLVFGNLCSQMGAPIWEVLTGRGILRPSVYTALLTSVLNVVLSLVFIMRWGFLGAAWGSVLPIIIANTYYFCASQKYLGVPFLQILRRAYLKPVLCSIVAGAASSAINVLVRNLWLDVLVGASAFAIIYLAGLLLARFFDEFDWSKLEAHVPLARHARRLIPISYATQD